MEWVTRNLHTTSEHGLSSITTADVHNSAASSRLNRRPRRFKWTRPFRKKTKSGFCACAVTFQTRSTTLLARIQLLCRPQFSVSHIFIHSSCDAVEILHTTARWKKFSKAVLSQGRRGPEGSRKLRFPDFMTSAQDGGKVVSLTHRPPLPPGNTAGTHFC